MHSLDLALCTVLKADVSIPAEPGAISGPKAGGVDSEKTKTALPFRVAFLKWFARK